MISKQRITNVPRDDISLRPDMYPCSLCWKDNLTLIIGWGNSVKVQLPVFVINACCYHRQTEDYFWKAKTIEKNRVWFDYSLQNSCCHRNVIGLTLMRRKSDRHPAVRQISVCEHAASVILRDTSLCLWEISSFESFQRGFWIHFISIKEEQLIMSYFWRDLFLRTLIAKVDTYFEPTMGWKEKEVGWGAGCLEFCFAFTRELAFRTHVLQAVCDLCRPVPERSLLGPDRCFLITACYIIAQWEIKSTWWE